MTHFSVRRILPVVLVLAGGTLALQCIETPDPFIAPTSEIQLSIPLADVSRTMEDLFSKDTSNVRRDGSGGFYYTDQQVSDPVPIDTLRVFPQSSGFEVALGAFEVDRIPPEGFSVTASELGITDYPFPVFPGASTTFPSAALPASTLFDSLAVSQGTLTLRIDNTLPVTVVFPNPITLRNSADNSLVATFAFDSLQEGEFKTVDADLAGIFVSGALATDALDLDFAPRSGPFTVPPNASLDFEFSSSSIIVDSAVAVVPSQQITSISDSIIVIDSTVSLDVASFSSGFFSARIINNLGIQVGALLRFDNFKNPVTGSVLEINEIIPPRTTREYPVNLDTVDLIDPAPALIGSRMKFSAAIQTINSSGAMASVTKNDFIRAEFVPQSEFVLEYVTGRINPMPIPIHSVTSGLSLGEAAEKFSGTFTFDSVRFDLDLGMSSGFPIEYDLLLEGVNNETGAYGRIPPAPERLTGIVQPGVGNFAKISIGNAAGLSAFLSTFIPHFPDSFIVSGSVTINPGFDVGTITDTTKIYQRVNTYFPLKFGLANGSLNEPVDLEDSNFPTDFVGDVKESTIRIAATNHLPVQLSFRADLIGPLGPDPGSPRGVVSTIPSDGAPRVILAPPVDAAGVVTASQLSEFRITMTPDEVEKFNRADTMIIRLGVETSGGGGQAVRYLGSDFVRIKMSGNLIYILNRQEGQ